MEENHSAKRRTKAHAVGLGGCLILLMGAGVAVTLSALNAVLGLIAAVVFIYLYFKQTRYFVCGNCGSKLADQKVKECPGCHSQIR